MKKLLILVAVIAIGVGIYCLTSKTEEVAMEAVFDGKNATFLVDGNEVTLVNGVAETPAAPGSVSKDITAYFGNEASGDLDGDGSADKVFLVTQTSGGSGLFYYAVAALRAAYGYKTTNSFLIGDRIAPQSMNINAREIHVNYAERKPGEPMTAEPSVGAVKLLKVSNGVLEGLMK